MPPSKLTVTIFVPGKGGVLIKGRRLSGTAADDDDIDNNGSNDDAALA